MDRRGNPPFSRADLTISDTKAAVMTITLSTPEKDGKIQFMISAALKCPDPGDAKAPAVVERFAYGTGVNG